MSTPRRRSPKLAPEPQFAEGHKHDEECAALYAEWKRGLRDVVFPAGCYAMRVFQGALVADSG